MRGEEGGKVRIGGKRRSEKEEENWGRKGEAKLYIEAEPTIHIDQPNTHVHTHADSFPLVLS